LATFSLFDRIGNRASVSDRAGIHALHPVWTVHTAIRK
jgi:hypothetical protein